MNKGRTLSYQGETYPLNEARTTNINRMIIVPYGYPKNYDLSNAQKGDIITFKDGKSSTIEGICIATTTSPMFDVLCEMVFGLPAVDIMKQWYQKYKNDIQYEHALIITYNAELR